MLKNNALTYLGCEPTKVPPLLEAMVEECIEEVKQVANPAFVSKTVNVLKNPLRIENTEISLAYGDLEKLLEKCEQCVIVAVTLGQEIERKTKYYAHSDMAKMSVFDAVASAYVEEVCDLFENKLQLGKRTMRFCPGYGDVDIALNKQLANLLQCDKHIGLFVQASNILLPQKSMIGIIGLGESDFKQSCTNCKKKSDCTLRKKGKTCY